jgi:deoxyribose-phosphate aldolase
VARKTLREQDTPDIKVATVANFPHGDDDVGSAVAETRAAVDAGADEVDAVFPYRAFLSGNKHAGFELVSRCKTACGGLPLKVIIETGELRERSFIVDATRICIEAGADFIKTSTGKVPVNATPASARIILETIRDLGVQKAVGFKAAGGIRTAEDAAKYLAIADEIFGPDWADKSHFRLGASSLLESVLRFLRKAGGRDNPSDC